MDQESKTIRTKCGIFIVPRSSFAWKGNEAGWITTAGWAAAGAELWGEAVVTTTDGVFSPQKAMLFPRISEKIGERNKFRAFRSLVPEVAITALKDFNLSRSKPREWPIEQNDILKDKEVKMIWQRHDLFSGPGRKLATKLGVPLVTSVEALAVWEARKWGVKRPLWGKFLEERVEAKALLESDLICCVSQEVKDKVISLGIAQEKVIITPNRVDSTLFHPNIDGSKVAERYGLKQKIVLGWTGSFRGFHALDNVISAFDMIHQKHPQTILMLVGDGLEFEAIKEMVAQRDLSQVVIMTGRKKFNEIPDYVANFDISMVSARSAEGFHYSPLKLREYMAAGKPVVAPNAGDLPNIFSDGKDLLLYQAGDPISLAEKILMLIENPSKRRELSENSIKWFETEGAWVHELKKVCDILKITY